MGMVIRGGGTGLRGGCIPNDAVVLDMSRMNKVLEVSRDYVRVEPGVVLSDLNYFLKKSGKHFPVVPISQDACTIGGMIATNAVGKREVKYGKTGNWIMEVEIIDGEGRYRKAELGDVVGKEGTSGVIISAKLRIIDLTKKRGFSIKRFDDINEIIFRMNEIKEASAVWFISRKAAELSGLEDGNYLIIETENGNEEEDKLEIIEHVYSSLVSRNHNAVEDFKFSQQNLARALAWFEERNIPVIGPVMSGVIHPFVQDKKAVKELYDVVEQLGGDVIGVYGVGMLKKSYLKSESAVDMRQLKMKYGSDDIINRRR
jgi:FAD/FMN-containing dehydrogenase